MTKSLITRLRELSDSSHSQSFVSIEIHELKALLDVVEAVQRLTQPSDWSNYDKRVALVKAIDALDEETNGT